MKKHSFRWNMIALSVASICTGSVLAAENEEKDEAKKDGVPTITVTARRVSENLQEVPVAVTAITSDELIELGATTITDVQQMTPNSTLQVSRGTNTTLTAYIRGIGQQDPLWGFEPGVGIYVDDVYIARPQGAVMDILDLERVEVLRGPQGTLYGKNTIGGAVKYVTKEMTGDKEFSFDATLGSYNQQDIKFTGQAPLVDQTLYLGFAVANLNRDGFGEYKNIGADNYNKDIATGRFTLEFRPTEDWFFRLNYDSTKDDSNAKGGYRLTPSLLTGQQPYDSVFDSDTSLPVFNRVESEGTSFTARWNLDEKSSIKYVAASRKGDTNTNIDFDNTELKSFDVPAIYDDKQETQEIQYSFNGESFQYVVGAYYYNGDACGAFGVQLEVLGQALSLPGYTLENGGCVFTQSMSYYGQASIDFNDQWSMTLGGRYTDDEKWANVYRHVFFDTVFPDEDVSPAQVQTDFTDVASWSEFSPRLGVEFKASDEVMYYTSYSKGFKSGGFDMRANVAANPDGDEPFDPETVSTLEFGIKSDWLNNRLRVNAAIFNSDYQDMQVTVQRAVGANDFASQVLNAAEATISGFEIEAVAVLSDDLNMNLSIGHIDGSFDQVDFYNPVTQQVEDVSDSWVISNTPEWSFNLGLDYSFNNDLGNFVIVSNWSHRSETHIFEVPSALDMDSYNLLNLGLNWYHPEGQWRGGLHIRNALDEEYRLAGYNFPATFDDQGNLVAPGLGLEDTVVGYYGDPRTISLTIGYDF